MTTPDPDASRTADQPADDESASGDDTIDLTPGAYRMPWDDPGHPAESKTSAWKETLDDWNGPVLRLIDRDATEAAATLRRGHDTYDGVRRVDRLLNELRARGACRKLQIIRPEWRAGLAAVEKRFPQFWEVIAYLRSAFTLAEHMDGVPQMLPMLVCGDAGCGKSYFAETFADFVGSGYLCVHLETAQANSSLAGSEEYWSNSRPGQLFNQLVFGEYGNPVVCLDEIDKVGQKTYDPLSPLYQLLEPATAKRFRDLSYPWLPPIDASRVLWIATANDATDLPEPILSRFRIFHINPLGVEEMEDLVRQIFARLATEMGEPVRSMQLSREAISLLSHSSPRRTRQLLLEAVGHALNDGRKRVLARDVSIAIEPELPPRRIGFF